MTRVWWAKQVTGLGLVQLSQGEYFISSKYKYGSWRTTVTMDPPTDEHQHQQLSNRKSKKGRKDEEGSSRNTAEGEDTSQEKKKASTGKKYNLFLTSLFISREVLLRIVVFLIVYLVLTRLVKLFTKE